MSQSCDSRTAAFAADIWAQMSEIASTAWKNSSRALQLQLYQKQIYHYKVAGIELEKYSTGHEIKSTMLKPDLPQHKPEPPLENQWIGYLQPLNFTFFALRNLYLGPF